MSNRLAEARVVLDRDVDSAGATQTVFEFREGYIHGAPIIDHVGDYEDRVTDPRYSEFGGEETLYDDDNF